MASVETNIWMALKQRVLVVEQSYAVAWPDQTFTPPTDTAGPKPYVIVTHSPNEPDRFLIGSNDPHDRLGILQLALMYPVAKNHTFEVINEKSGQIAALFPTDLKLPFGGVTVRITKAPYVAGSYRDDAYIRVPIQINWQTFA